jgi:hypothetical protein
MSCPNGTANAREKFGGLNGLAKTQENRKNGYTYLVRRGITYHL